MAKWSAWGPDVMPHALGASYPLMEQEVRRAAHEFLRRTRAWTEWLAPEKTRPEGAEYEFDVPQGAAVLRIERATLDGRPFAVHAALACPSDWTEHGLDSPGLVSADRTTFRIAAGMAPGRAMQVQVSLVPSEKAAGIPDALAHQHHDAIRNGALARLLAVPGQAWTDMNLAAYRTALFEGAIDAATVDVWRSHTRNTPRTRIGWC